MISRRRSTVPRPPILDPEDPASPASVERQRAIDHVADPDSHPKPDFSVYSEDPVKLALIQLFEGKCAYCESKVSVVAARDIEHYRPKGRIDPGSGEEAIQPGYYWLAAEWDNLLLSCPACNRRQRQVVAAENGELAFTEEASGKLDLFPLGPTATRARGPDDDLELEEPGRLLLNPCLDRPDRHLRYDKSGNVFARKIGGRPSAKAEASIDAYVLWRPDLVSDRAQRFLDIKQVWDNIKLGAQMIDSLDASQKSLIARLILTNEATLLGYSESGRRYCGMARWLSRGYLRELREIKQSFRDRFGESMAAAAG